MNKKFLKLFLKLLLTAVAVFLVIRKIDVQTTWQVIKGAQWAWLFLALVFYAASKAFCAFRLNGYFRDIGVKLPEMENLKLYGIGMFYNLFLPGGIGGDGYKVYLLNKSHQTPVKKLLNAVILDRGNGLAVLVFLMFFILLFVKIDWPLPIGQIGVALAGLILVPIGLYVVMLLFFKDFMASIIPTTVYSMLNQVLQLLCAYLILLSLGIRENEMVYLLVFLLSSIVSVLPLTIGGVGARELVFVFSHEYVGIDKNAAVAFSLLFFVVAAFTSLLGGFLKFNPSVQEKEA